MKNITSEIQNLIQYIGTFGLKRHIKRLDIDTLEVRDTAIITQSDMVEKVKLTKEQEILLAKEGEMVFPIIDDQLEHAYELLKEDPESRQAIIINNPLRAHTEEFPCISLIHFLSEDKNKISISVFMRSSDVKNYLLVDIVFLYRLLKYFAERLNKKPGMISLFISSAHVYDGK